MACWLVSHIADTAEDAGPTFRHSAFEAPQFLASSPSPRPSILNLPLFSGSILIFVSGIFDIIEITDMIEKMGARCDASPLGGSGRAVLQLTAALYVRYQCLGIHSDIPFEEQLDAFQPAEEGRVKVRCFSSVFDVAANVLA